MLLTKNAMRKSSGMQIKSPADMLIKE